MVLTIGLRLSALGDPRWYEGTSMLLTNKIDFPTPEDIPVSEKVTGNDVHFEHTTAMGSPPESARTSYGGRKPKLGPLYVAAALQEQKWSILEQPTTLSRNTPQ